MASTKISALSTDSTPDRVADYLPTYDASAVGNKKVLLSLAGAYVITGLVWFNVSPADSTTYYLSPWEYALSSTAVNNRLRIPRTGKVLAVYFDGIITGPGSTENTTMSFRLNDTTDTTISSVVQFNASPFAFSNTALGIAVTAGDYFGIKLACPAWATNPTGIYGHVAVYIA